MPTLCTTVYIHITLNVCLLSITSTNSNGLGYLMCIMYFYIQGVPQRGLILYYLLIYKIIIIKTNLITMLMKVLKMCEKISYLTCTEGKCWHNQKQYFNSNKAVL